MPELLTGKPSKYYAELLIVEQPSGILMFVDSAYAEFTNQRFVAGQYDCSNNGEVLCDPFANDMPMSRLGRAGNVFLPTAKQCRGQTRPLPFTRSMDSGQTLTRSYAAHTAPNQLESSIMLLSSMSGPGQYAGSLTPEHMQSDTLFVPARDGAHDGVIDCVEGQPVRLEDGVWLVHLVTTGVCS